MDTPFLKGTHRLSCALCPWVKQTLHRNLGQTCLKFLEDLLGKWGVTVAHCWGTALEAKVLGIIITLNSFRGGHFGKIWPTHQIWEAPGQTTNQVGTQPNHQQTGCLKTPPGTQPPLITPRDKVPPPRGVRISSSYQWAGTSPSHQEACSKPPYQLQPQGGQASEGRLKSYSLQKKGTQQKAIQNEKTWIMLRLGNKKKTQKKKISDLEITSLPEKDFRLIAKMVNIVLPGYPFPC